MIHGLQIIASLFSLFMIYLALLNYRRGELDKTEFISWTIIWSLTELVVIFPNLLRDFALNFFITRLFDLMVIGGFILVISMVSRSYLSTKKTEKKLEELIRLEAVRKARRKSSK
jgi:hypothetical protein